MVRNVAIANIRIWPRARIFQPRGKADRYENASPVTLSRHRQGFQQGRSLARPASANPSIFLIPAINSIRLIDG
jgi:hypothetical protein